MSTSKKFIVKRSEWVRGTGTTHMLRSTDGKKDLLGFLALSEICEGTKEQVLDCLAPHNAKEIKWPEAFWNGQSTNGLKYHSQLALDLMNTNDAVSIKEDTEREEKLKALLASIDLEVEFVD